jgi:hypothetical protein
LISTGRFFFLLRAAGRTSGRVCVPGSKGASLVFELNFEALERLWVEAKGHRLTEKYHFVVYSILLFDEYCHREEMVTRFQMFS